MNKEQFKEELKKLNITLTKNQENQLEEYYNLLIEENKKINLTTITKKRRRLFKTLLWFSNHYKSNRFN